MICVRAVNTRLRPSSIYVWLEDTINCVVFDDDVPNASSRVEIEVEQGCAQRCANKQQEQRFSAGCLFSRWLGLIILVDYYYLLRKYMHHVPIHQCNATVLDASERTHSSRASQKSQKRTVWILHSRSSRQRTRTNRLALINSNVFASGKWFIGKYSLLYCGLELEAMLAADERLQCIGGANIDAHLNALSCGYLMMISGDVEFYWADAFPLVDALAKRIACFSGTSARYSIMYAPTILYIESAQLIFFKFVSSCPRTIHRTSNRPQKKPII